MFSFIVAGKCGIFILKNTVELLNVHPYVVKFRRKNFESKKHKQKKSKTSEKG